MPSTNALPQRLRVETAIYPSFTTLVVGSGEQSLNVLTIIHNFDLKRHDGTTAAQRLFGHEFPDVFEWMLDHVGELPVPRRSSKPQPPKPLYADVFPA